jgi:hypothetical protein
MHLLYDFISNLKTISDRFKVIVKVNLSPVHAVKALGGGEEHGSYCTRVK